MLLRRNILLQTRVVPSFNGLFGRADDVRENIGNGPDSRTQGHQGEAARPRCHVEKCGARQANRLEPVSPKKHILDISRQDALTHHFEDVDFADVSCMISPSRFCWSTCVAMKQLSMKLPTQQLFANVVVSTFWW